MIKASLILLFIVFVIVLVKAINNRNEREIEREIEKANGDVMIDFFNLLSVMENGEPNVLYIDYTNDKINENFTYYLKENEIVYTVDVVEQDGIKYYKVIYKEYLGYGKKYIQHHIENYIFADVVIPNIYTELPMNFENLKETGEKIARSFFYTNEYLKYRNNKYGTFVIEYKDITAYVAKELERYTDKEYCSDDYVTEVYMIRRYTIKSFQKLLEENTPYYAEIEIDGDTTYLIINEK